MNFSPTFEQKLFAQNALIARTLYVLVQKSFDRFISDELATRDYYYADRYRQGMLKEMMNTPENGILRNIDHINMMEGRNLPSLPGSVNSTIRFNTEIGQRASAAGYKHRELAETNAFYEMNHAIDNLLFETKNIHGIDHLVLLPDEEKEAVATKLLNLFQLLPITPDYFEREINYFLRHLQIPFTKNNLTYQDNQIALDRFLAYKKFIQTDQYLLAIGKTNEAQQYENLSGVFAYLPGYIIYRYKEPEQWQQSSLQPMHKKYRFESVTSGQYDSDDIEELEGLAFDDFITSFKG